MSKDTSVSICRFFQSGFCAKGDQCQFQHVRIREQPSNVHIPLAKREAFERAIRGLPADSAPQSSAPRPATPSGTPPPELIQPSQQHGFEQRHQGGHNGPPVHQQQEWERPRLISDAARQEVIKYFEQFLLSKRRQTPGGHLERECVAVFEDYINQLLSDGNPVYQSHADWVDQFNVYWGPNGAGVAKWLSHGILGNYLAGKLGFQWRDAEQQAAPSDPRYNEQQLQQQPFHPARQQQRGPTHLQGNGSPRHHQNHQHHQQHFPPPPPPPTATDHMRQTVEPEWGMPPQGIPPQRISGQGRGQGLPANPGRLLQEQVLADQRLMQEQRMMQSGLAARQMSMPAAPPGHTVALVPAGPPPISPSEEERRDIPVLMQSAQPQRQPQILILQPTGPGLGTFNVGRGVNAGGMVVQYPIVG